jgi:hypothetical protein
MKNIFIIILLSTIAVPARSDKIFAESAADCPAGTQAIDRGNVVIRSACSAGESATDIGDVAFYKSGQPNPNADEKGAFVLSQCGE